MSAFVRWLDSSRWIILAGIMGSAVGRYASSPEPHSAFLSNAALQSVSGAVENLLGKLLGIYIARADLVQAVPMLDASTIIATLDVTVRS